MRYREARVTARTPLDKEALECSTDVETRIHEPLAKSVLHDLKFIEMF